MYPYKNREIILKRKISRTISGPTADKDGEERRRRNNASVEDGPERDEKNLYSTDVRTGKEKKRTEKDGCESGVR